MDGVVEPVVAGLSEGQDDQRDEVLNLAEGIFEFLGFVFLFVSVFDVDFIDGGFSVEFGDVVETGQALVVAFAGEEELGGLY